MSAATSTADHRPAAGEAPKSALRQRFLDGMSHAAATVNIVTTDGPAGRHGVTVSAMSAVSADSASPSLLVCVHHKSQACAAIAANGVFCVNVLRDDQSAISDTFAGRTRTSSGDKFEAATWTTQKTGAPRIVDPLVAFDCEVKETLRYGSHHVFIGEVADIFVEAGGSPLIYANRAYGRPALLSASNLHPAPTGERLRLGSLVTLAPFIVPGLVARLAASEPGLDITLTEEPHTLLLESLARGAIDVALTYGFDLAPGLETDRLGEVPTYVLLPEDHALAHQSRVALGDLAALPMILLDLPMSRDYFLGLFGALGLAPLIRFRSSNFETVRGLVGHGLGYALLGTKPASAMTYDGRGVVARPLADTTPQSPIVLAMRPGARARPAVAALRRAAAEMFGA